MQSLQETLFAVAFLSLLATLIFGYTVRRRRAQETWPSVAAQVRAAKSFEESDEAEGAHSAVVYLSYRWEGETFTLGKLHDEKKVFPSRALAEAHLAAHPIGQTHTIRVNPRKPSDAVVYFVDAGPAAIIYRWARIVFLISALAFAASLFLSWQA
jgi:hypothetical protein